MSNADEIFESIGYKKYDKHPEQDYPPEPNMFTTQDCRRLYYEEEGLLENGAEVIEHIEFDLNKKVVVCWATLNNRNTVVPLNMKELKAIYEKCKERGWLNE